MTKRLGGYAMSGWINRARILTLGVLAAGAVVLLVVVPALGESHPDVDRLHMVSGGDAFIYGDTVQPLTVGGNSCEIVDPTSGPIAILSSNAGAGGIKGPGIHDHGLGVKSGGSNGTPCSETSDLEVLTITSFESAWYKLRLNVEAKGEAWIVVELLNGSAPVETHQLVTGGSIAAYNADNEPDVAPTMTFPYTATTQGDLAVAACADPNDSGPDSGPNDNCLWTILTDGGAVFDTVRISTKVGYVSLEGGHDFEALSETDANNGVYDSLFYRAQGPVALGEDLTATEDAPTIFYGSDLATDPDGNDANLAITAAAVDNGTITDNGDGTWTYIPVLNSCGEAADTVLTFTVEDEQGLTVTGGSVAINITCVNDAPDAANDTYVMDERDPANKDGFATLTVPADGVLANDNDIDGDSLRAGPLTPITTEKGGTAVLLADGSFSYTPAPYAWIEGGDLSYEDSWGYTVYDGDPSNPNTLTSSATVAVTVHRVVCPGEPVGDAEGVVSGLFTLLENSNKCRRYEVTADEDGNTVTLALPDPPGEGNAFFRGELTFAPKVLDAGGTFSLGIEYSPNNDGNFKTLQICINPQFDADGLVFAAEIPDLETWCLASALSVGSPDPAPEAPPGEISTLYQVYGEEDPSFSGR